MFMAHVIHLGRLALLIAECYTSKNIILLFSCTTMFSILIQVSIVSAILYALWKLQRQFFDKLALDDIPGPPSQSFLFGEFYRALNL